jgi:hypothetical protein
MNQLSLFDLAQVAPSKGERREQIAAARRNTDAERKSANRFRRWMKAEVRRERERAQPAHECCLYWYPAGSGWTHCHKCGKALYP